MLSNFIEEKYKGEAILTYKGREAIGLALARLNLSEGNGVAVTGFTCIAVIDAIENQNLKPVYVDIDSQTLNFSAKSLEDKVKNEKVKVVIIQNTLGYPCDIEGIKKVCKKYNLFLIEDLAHSIGTYYSNGQEAGSIGDFVVLSFSQDKVVDGVSGGAVIIKNSKFKIKNLGGEDDKIFFQDKIYPLLTLMIRKMYPFWVGKLLHVVFKSLRLLSDPMKNPLNTNLSNWHAELILFEFKNLEKNLNHRKNIAKIYSHNLDKKIVSEKICEDVGVSTNLRFPIFVKNRDSLVAYLKNRGVYISDIWYDFPVAPKKYLGLAKYPKSSCPNAEIVSGLILNLPTHINVSEKDAYKISTLINQWLQH